MKIVINSGLGDMVNFLPFAVELAEKRDFEIVGNKYSKEICDLAGLTNVTHDTAHTVMIPPPDAVVLRFKRYGGNGTYLELYQRGLGVLGDRAKTWYAIGIGPVERKPRVLWVDKPRPSGLGSILYTPAADIFDVEHRRYSAHFDFETSILQPMPLRSLFKMAAECTSGFGQIGFVTAFCQLFNKTFYAVKGADEPQEKFELRKKAVCL